MAKAPATTATTETPEIIGTARTAPIISMVSAAVPLPVANGRGRAGLYPFDELTAVGMSFGLVNRTAKNMGSVVSAANRRALVQAKNEDGSLKFDRKEVKPASISETGELISAVFESVPVMVASKKFQVFETDPATDPHKATCRIFRVE